VAEELTPIRSIPEIMCLPILQKSIMPEGGHIVAHAAVQRPVCLRVRELTYLNDPEGKGGTLLDKGMHFRVKRMDEGIWT